MASAIPVSPPQGFATLQQAKTAAIRNAFQSVIGVVSSVEPGPGRSSDSDPCIVVSLIDASVDEKLLIYFYYERTQQPAEILRFMDNGNVAIVRNIKWLGSRFVSNYNTDMTAVIVKEKGRTQQYHHMKQKQPGWALTQQEQNYVDYLRVWAENVTIFNRATVPTAAAPMVTTLQTASLKSLAQPTRRQKHALLSSVTNGQYCDVTVEILHVYISCDTATLYVTDYTENSLFFDKQPGGESYSSFEHQGKWQAPEGRMSLQITAFAPHSTFLRDNGIGEGQILAIRNLRIVHGKNALNVLEGKLHTDQKFPHNVSVFLVPATSQLPEYQELQSRRAKYLVSKGPVGAAGELDSEQAESVNRSSKYKKKRDREKLKKQKERQEHKDRERSDQVADPFTSAKFAPLNGHVETGHDTKAVVSLASVLQSQFLYGKTEQGTHMTYPFINVCFKSKVRVVDFYPPKLEDFAHDLEDMVYNDAPTPASDVFDIDSSLVSRWEWAFWLLLQDIQPNSRGELEQMKVLVAGPNAEYLLKLGACNLRESKSTLAQLREILFVLWGELAERKAKTDEQRVQLVNKPFECCIQEYGVPDGQGGWSRMHRMFHTTIK